MVFLDSNIAVILNRNKLLYLLEPIEISFNVETLFFILISNIVDLLGKGKNLDRNITCLMN